MSSSMGQVFVVTTFGESHGRAVGAVVDGCPPGLTLEEKDIQKQLDRRRPGQGSLTTSRDEMDVAEILSGTGKGVTLGTPVAILVRNSDARPSDYERFADVPRPSHADLTYKLKYGIVVSSGGGRASARETVGRVAAGAVADKYLKDRHGVEIVAWTSSIGTLDASNLVAEELTRKDVDANEVRCPDSRVAAEMASRIEAARADGDSVGGIVTCVCRGVPAGWGEPVFGKLEAALAAAMLSIPASKGFEVGSGFAGSGMRGSEHNDLFVAKDRGLGTLTNRSGGIQGGISNGEPIVFRVAFKPPASIARAQTTAAYDGSETTLEGGGRHDPCVVPRAVAVVEAMASLVLADAALLARGNA